MPPDLLVLRERQRDGGFDDEHEAVARIRHHAERNRFGDQHVVARLVGEAPEFGGKLASALVHEVQKVAVRVAVSEGHCRPATADSHADVPVGEHHLRRAAWICQVGRLDIGSVGNPARVQGTFDAHDLVGAMLAVDHGDRAEEALPTDVLFAQVAEADPCLADMPPLGVVDPGTHGSTPFVRLLGA